MTAIRYALILALVFLPASPFATTFPVTKTADTDDGSCDPDCSLREAIEAANANPGADNVPVPAGTYLLNLGQLVVSDDVAITGTGQANTIIDGKASNRVFEIQSEVVADISGVTIQNGYAVFRGGGIYNKGGDLTLTSSTVSGNYAFYYAGGISSWGYLTLIDSAVSENTSFMYNAGGIENSGDLTLTNSTVSGNSTYGYGGGIYTGGNDLTLTNSTVSGNTAGHGGGIFIRGGYLTLTSSAVSGNTGGGIRNVLGYVTLTSSTVSGNTGAIRGGGIFNRGNSLGGGYLTLTNSTVSGNDARWGGGIINEYWGTAILTNTTVNENTASQLGGGIRISGGYLSLTNSTVSGNAAYYEGGGIHMTGHLYHDSTVTVTNSTVSGNTAGVRGGGIANVGRFSPRPHGATFAFTNSTVSGNIASSYGGGIHNSSPWISQTTLTNMIVADNSAPTDANCNGDDATSLGYNLADDASCGFFATGDLVVADAMLGPLADNGGPTETHALLPGSPAIDAGSVNCPPPSTDQRGVPRPQGAACDIGAVEYVPEPRGSVMLIAGVAFLGLLYRRRR
jgi:CSLREA domain-containing protein